MTCIKFRFTCSLFAVLLAAMLTGCTASVPIRGAPTASPAPYLAGEQSQRFRGTDVLWGGTIVDHRDFERYTELEIVAFPLDYRQRPLLDAPVSSRCVAKSPASAARRCVASP